jgi:TonB family protein
VPPRPRRDASQLSLRAAKPANPIPRLTLPEAAGADDLGTGPNVNVPPGVPRSGDLATPGLVALSATPSAPQRRLRLPDENLRARFVAGPSAGSGSPGGVLGGTPGASGGSGGGPGGYAGGGEGLIVPDVLVTPAGDVPPGPVIVGPQGGGAPPVPQRERAESRASNGGRAAAPASAPAPPPATPQERGLALLEAVKAGGSGPRKLYITYLYLANLTSQSSSWLMQFAESLVSSSTSAEALLVPPQVRKKVDPCYPKEAEFAERVEGVVVVYGLVRADGRVEDPVVMRGINPRIDQAALDAFARSLFEPARKRGKPVAIDALVEIPFRFVPCQ